MFLTRRPSMQAIKQFLEDSRDLPLSYEPVGLVRSRTAAHRIDELTAVIGHGTADFDRARTALGGWTQFDIGWVELFPPRAPVAVGTVVAILTVAAP